MEQTAEKVPGLGAFFLPRHNRQIASRLLLIAVAAPLAVPLIVVFSSLLVPQSEIWSHLLEFVLPDLLVNTLWLVIGVGAGTAVLGVSLAWLTALYEFPGRAFFSWALLLPLAVPAYVTAFVVIGLFDFSGPVQSELRVLLGEDFRLPSIRSRGGVIFVMTLALYPYVYLLARNAFLTQGTRMLETAQSLGLSRARGFFRAALPMARPWIAGGLGLVLMETLADFGAVATFNYDTFTTAIYKTWFGLFSLTTAAQLSSMLLLIVLVIVLIEQRLRMQPRYHAKPGREKRMVLSRGRAWATSLYAALVLSVAFIVPALQLLVWSGATMLDSPIWSYLWRSLALGAFAAILTAAVAVILAYISRNRRDLTTRVAIRFATFGYAIPGAVLAVGLFIPLAWLDEQVAQGLKVLFDIEAGRILQGTLAIMLFAYLARFLAVNFNPVEAAMLRITQSTEEAARGLGLDSKRVLLRVHLPMLRGGVLTGALLVFVDVMKEMPITLMTRPFGWDTLAVRIFELTSEGQWEQAAVPALALIAAGLVPIIWLSRHAGKS